MMTAVKMGMVAVMMTLTLTMGAMELVVGLRIDKDLKVDDGMIEYRGHNNLRAVEGDRELELFMDISEAIDNDDDDIKFEFDSAMGKRILTSSYTSLESYFAISEHFATQDNLGYCGVASATIVLNAFGNKIPQLTDSSYSPYKYFTQTDLMKDECVGEVLGIQRYVFFRGLTLDEVSETVKCFNTTTQVVRFPEGVKVDSSEYQDAILSLQKHIMSAIDDGFFVITNIDRPELGETGSGHFSPLGAYYKYNAQVHNSLAMFLFMDTARYKYKPMWIQGEALVHAMLEKDSVTKKTRGFIIVGGPEDDIPEFELSNSNTFSMIEE